MDGYNVIYQWPDLRPLVSESLELARDALVSQLAVYAQVTGAAVTVVFDAHRSGARRTTREAREGVDVVYTGAGKSADHYVERQAYLAAERGEPILVATSDRFHRDMLRGMGAAVIDAGELRRRVDGARADLERQLRRDYSR